jgi:hypothetical protein
MSVPGKLLKFSRVPLCTGTVLGELDFQKVGGGGPVGQTAIGSGLTVGGRGGSGLQPLEILDFGIKILPLERIQQEAFAASRLGPASHQPSSPPFLVCCPRGQSHRLQAMALQRHHGIGLGPPAAHRSLCYSMVYIKTVKKNEIG